MRLKVGLLGGGSWGTTVAATVSRNAPITLWARDAETVDGINRDQENRKYLPGIRLPTALRATADLITTKKDSPADADECLYRDRQAGSARRPVLPRG